MKETHVCLVDGEGGTVLETSIATLRGDSDGAGGAPACQRLVLETGRMAPTLYHGLEALGVPVVCIESRQAYLALKSGDTQDGLSNDIRN